MSAAAFPLRPFYKAREGCHSPRRVSKPEGGVTAHVVLVGRIQQRRKCRQLGRERGTDGFCPEEAGRDGMPSTGGGRAGAGVEAPV